MTKKILSIDGGGIRGILPGQILTALEQKLRQRDGDHARLADYFDMFAGTSTGAILGGAYACPDVDGRPKFTAQEAVDLYLEEGDEIFDISLWRSISTVGGLTDEKYSADELEELLEENFGDVLLSQLLRPTCFVAYDINRRRPVIFTQHDAIKEDRDFYVRDMLRATSAAPTYFEAAKIYSVAQRRKKFAMVDGGVIANDPTLCAYSEAINVFDDVNGFADMMFLSLGTGKNLRRYSHSEVKDWGPIGWAKPAIDIALEGGPQMTKYHMQMIANTVQSDLYFRIEPEMHGADTALDNASPENLDALREAGELNAEALEDSGMLTALVELLEPIPYSGSDDNDDDA